MLNHVIKFLKFLGIAWNVAVSKKQESVQA